MKLLPSFIIQLLGHRYWPGVFRDLRSFQCCVPSDWFSGCLVVEYFTAGREAHWRRIPPSTKQTGSSFLHLCMLNPGCGLVCVMTFLSNGFELIGSALHITRCDM